MNVRIVTVGWIIASICLLLYSLTQIDLGLTLTRASFWQGIQSAFQHIGYFNRPLSTTLYIIIVCLFISLYLWTLWLSYKNKLKRKDVWTLILIVSGILFFSYNAFSYDLFNYMFDAKIVTYYQDNPYERRALDYPGDPMLSFMHWIHRVLPYGPIWLVLTVPLSYLGFNILLLTFYLFKSLIIGGYLVSVFFLEKIVKRQDDKHPLFSVALYALNPLIILEFLVSAHNDSVMIAFLMISLYFLTSAKTYLSILFLILSMGIKLTTAFLQPAYIFYFLQKKFDTLSLIMLTVSVPAFLFFNKTDYVVPSFLRALPFNEILISYYYLFIPILGFVLYWVFGKKQIFYIASILILIIPVVLAAFRTDFQPWYITVMLALAACSEKKYYLVVPSIIISCLLLLHYIPFLYTGSWDPPIPTILFWITWGSVIASAIAVLIIKFAKPRSFHV